METKVVVGKAALVKHFEAMRTRLHKNSDGARLFELERFQAYRWLLSNEQRSELTAWIKQTLESVA
eukprot:1608846-Lingulodinium_polyedra.AAC.1